VDRNFKGSTIDDLMIDRSRVASRSREIAKSHSKTTPSYFRLTPTVTRVLDATKRQAPEIELHESLTKISTKQEHRKARSLVDRANGELKEVGVLKPKTLGEIASFTESMSKKSVLTKQISDDGIVGVLYFGR
jgi:methyl coenzyme M reductase subunit C-like uncharacterized protein (methanogenesis marker protein 7)